MPVIRNMLKRSGPESALIVLFLCFTMVFTISIPVTAAATKAKTTMKHSPHDYFVPAYRIQMDVTVGDPAGVNLVRCYFKASGEADFVFVPMTDMGGSDRGIKFSGILPAPSSATRQIEYLFLAVNKNNTVVKSHIFVLKRKNKNKPPAWQDIPKEGNINVSMELNKVPSQLRGFSDNIVMNRVESGARFGVVAGGLYYLTKDKKSHTSGKAAKARAAGTVTASAAGYSTALVVGTVLAGAAIAGGTVAAISGGGGGGGGGDGDSHAEDLTEKTIVGAWGVTGTSSTDGSTTSGTITYNNNGTFSYNLTWTISGSTDQGSGTGTWTLYGTYLTLNFDAGAVYEGQASGDSKDFTMVATNNSWTLNFSR